MWISKYFHHELTHFKTLSETAQRHLISIAVYELTYPLLFIFLNAFILRQTSSFAAVAIYNLGMFCALPLTFYLNGMALKRTKIHYPYILGIIGQGLAASLVFFFPLSSLWSLFGFGLLQGIPMGFYWANRNFVNLDATTDDNRNYYNGIEMLLTTIAGIITPAVLGWIIRLGDFVTLYTAEQAYQGLNIVALGLLLFSGWLLMAARIDNPLFNKLLLGRATPLWNVARLLEVLRGVQNGFDLFLAPLVSFTFFGKEGTFGALQSTSAVLDALALYAIARYAKPKHRLKALGLGVALLVVSTCLFSFQFSFLAALIFSLLMRPIFHLNWTVSNPITMRVIDEEDGGDPTNNYAYVVDREFFLNIGRVAGIGLFFAFLQYSTQEQALRWVPLVPAFLQVGLWWCAKKLAAKH
ncbi:MAG TPA: MFS transporter [Vitreimonas sp.]|nr:MFS transporter [Vitreimonas sp.]